MSAACAVCKQKAEQRCSRCSQVRYCGVEHQRSDWGNHKGLCSDLVKAKTDGWAKTIFAAGNGQTPSLGKRLKMSYKGSLVSGQQFDASDSFTFSIGTGEVIKGWDEGIMTMSVGEKARLVLSPDYAYGERGVPPDIPPSSFLVFEGGHSYPLRFKECPTVSQLRKYVRRLAAKATTTCQLPSRVVCGIIGW